MFIKIGALRTPNPAQGGGGSEDPFAGYEETVTGEVEGKAPAEENPADQGGISDEEKAELAKVAADENIVRKEGKTAEEIAAETAKKEEKLAEEEGEGKGSEEFTIDDLEGTKVDENGNPEDEYSWSEIGTEIGLAVEDNSIEGMKTAVENMKTTIREEAINEYLEKEKGYTPEAIRLVNALNAGATDLEIFEAQQPYIDFLAMSAEEKIIEQAKANGLSEQKGKERYDELIEEGTLEETVDAIDKSVKTMMLSKRNELLNSYQQLADQKKADNLATQKAENELILKTLSARTEFNGKKLSPEVIKQLSARWNQGLYRKAFESDPNAVVDFILNKELGKKITADQVSEAEKQAKKNVHSKLHNLDTAKGENRTASQSSKAAVEVDPNDPFKDYAGLDEKAEYRINYGR